MRWWVAVVGLAVLAAIGGVVVLASGGGEGGDGGTGGEGSWLLPAVLFDEAGVAEPIPTDVGGVVPGVIPSTFASEAGPAFWPESQTISLWRSGGDWVVVHSYPPPNVNGILPLLPPLFGSTMFGETGWPSLPPPVQFEGPYVERWIYASKSLDPRAGAAFEAGLWEDPQPEVIRPPIKAFADDMGDFDPELRAVVEAFELTERVTIESDSSVGLVLAASDSGGFGVYSLATPIPLAVIPLETAEVIAGDGYEIHEYEERSLIVRDGEVHASISGPERGRVARSVVEVDDLRWGEWAWPRLAVFLRLGDLEVDATEGGGSCGLVIILDESCLEDATPETGFVWEGDGPSLDRGDGSWVVTLPVESVGLEVEEGGRRLGVVRQNSVLFEFDLSDVPGEVEATFATRREALQVMKMLYPDESLPG